MNDKLKQKGIAFGWIRRIAIKATVSVETVRKVLLERTGVSIPTRKKVLRATQQVQKQAAKEATKLQQLHDATTNISRP